MWAVVEWWDDDPGVCVFDSRDQAEQFLTETRRSDPDLRALVPVANGSGLRLAPDPEPITIGLCDMRHAEGVAG